MLHKFYHGDPSREHRFWIYPKHKPLINSQWDAYDPFDLCNNFTLLDANCDDTQMYKCNGHLNEWHDAVGFSSSSFHGNVTMPHKVYHGDPSREHRFWVYPEYKLLQNSQWDAYDPFDICDNFTLLDANYCTDTPMYKCNGHSNGWYGCAQCSQFCFQGNVTMPHKIYHGDPSRQHHFWIYPKNEPLINSRWDAYDPFDLCNNFTFLDTDEFTQLRTYKCNGHPNEWYNDGGYSSSSFHGNITMPHKVYHGDSSRKHHFWVYPKHKPLINSQWDAYDPSDLCNNFTLLDTDQFTQLRTYKCNGH